MGSNLRLNRPKRILPVVLGWALPVGFIGLLFYYPLGTILLRGLSPATLSTLANSQVQNAIAFTLWQAGISVVLCLALGLPLAYQLYRKTFRGAASLRNFLVIPFVLPTIVVAIALQPIRWLPAWLLIIIANLFLNLSVFVRIVGTVWQRLDSNTDDAASLDGATPLQVVLRIQLPMLRSAIASAAALVFLYCATSFGIVLIFGAGSLQSIETMTYFALNQHLDFDTASALAIVQTLITVAAFAISNRFGQAEQSAANENALKPASKIAGAFVFSAIAVFFVIPIANILIRGLEPAAIAQLDSLGARGLLDVTVWQALLNSLRNSVIAASIAMLIGTLVAKLVGRKRWLQLWWVLPLGVSSVTLGFGYLVAFANDPIKLRASWMVVPLVQALLAVPLVVRQLGSALAGVPAELAESAATAGANRIQIWWQIEAPLIAPAIKNALAFALLTSLGEFGAASLLSYGDQSTLPVILYRLISRPGEQNYSMAMASAAILILFVFAVTALASSRSRKLVD